MGKETRKLFENLEVLRVKLSVMGLENVAAVAERQEGLLVILFARCGHCPFHPTGCALIWTLCLLA